MNWYDDIKDIIADDYHPDINTDMRIREEKVHNYIKSLLKKQREICAKIYQNYDSIGEKPPIYDQILNAPEP